MPWRTIKDSIKYSKTIDGLNWFEEVCFYRLLVTADDFGRFYRDPVILKNELFPRKGNLTAKSIDDAFETLERVSLIKCYWVSDERYLQITTWSKHQRTRAATSKFPGIDEAEGADCGIVRTDDIPASDICPTDDGQMLPNKNKSKNKSTMKENARAREDSSPPSTTSFIPDDEAEKLANDHNEIFDKMRYCGFTLNQKVMDDAVALYAEHGKGVLLSAIEECAGASGNKMRYLSKILQNLGKPKAGEEEFNFI